MKPRHLNRFVAIYRNCLEMPNMALETVMLSRSGASLPVNLGFTRLDFVKSQYTNLYSSLHSSWPQRSNISYEDYNSGSHQTKNV
jgi:hypothetical protein